MDGGWTDSLSLLLGPSLPPSNPPNQDGFLGNKCFYQVETSPKQRCRKFKASLPQGFPLLQRENPNSETPPPCLSNWGDKLC